ncbi:MAG: NYN domain-containing protein [Rhodocyclaceae bacterium]
MASPNDSVSMALFCDFENVALGVRDAKYEKFDIKRVLERLLLKGSIVVKKAYCDWDRYKGFKSAMHEANFELIEIPHVRQSGKNSADIRLVVDALDLCYTKSHVDTFVIISGDSDFSPLVSKLRENAKQVIGVGVKQSTSDLLIANCDEFIFYDDLVRDSERAAAKRDGREQQAGAKKGEDDKRRKDDVEARRSQAIEIAVSTFDALLAERGDSGKIWASMLKEAIKRRKPDFNESYFGFRAFGNLLEEAQARGLLAFDRDEKSGAFVYRKSHKSDVPPAAAVAPGAAPERAERKTAGGRRGKRAADEGERTLQAADQDARADTHLAAESVFDPAPRLAAPTEGELAEREPAAELSATPRGASRRDRGGRRAKQDAARPAAVGAGTQPDATPSAPFSTAAETGRSSAADAGGAGEPAVAAATASSARTGGGAGDAGVGEALADDPSAAADAKPASKRTRTPARKRKETEQKLARDAQMAAASEGGAEAGTASARPAPVAAPETVAPATATPKAVAPKAVSKAAAPKAAAPKAAAPKAEGAPAEARKSAPKRRAPRKKSDPSGEV